MSEKRKTKSTTPNERGVARTQRTIQLAMVGAGLTAAAVWVAAYFGTNWFVPAFVLAASALLPFYIQHFGSDRYKVDELEVLGRRTSSVRELKQAYDKELDELRKASRQIVVSASGNSVVNMADVSPLTAALAVEESRALADDFRRLAARERSTAFVHRVFAAVVVIGGGYLVHQDLSSVKEFSALLVTRKVAIGLPAAVMFTWLQRLANEHFLISDWASRVAVQLAPIGNVTLLLTNQSERNEVIRNFLTNVFVGASQPTTRTRSKSSLAADVSTRAGGGKVGFTQAYEAGSTTVIGIDHTNAHSPA